MSYLRYALPILATLAALIWFFNPGGLRAPQRGSAELIYDLSAIEACTLDALMSFEAANTELAERVRAHDRAGEPAHALIIAAQNGEPDSMFELGVYYALTAQSEDENQRAGEWLERAAKADHLDAQNEVAIGYAYGYYGIGEDHELARDWLKQAAIRGDARAQNALAGLYQRGLIAPSGDDERAANDIALQLYLDAARQCYPAALTVVADRLSTGRGLPRDRDTGTRLTALVDQFRSDGGFVETN